MASVLTPGNVACEEERSGVHIVAVGGRVGRDLAASAEFGHGGRGFVKAGLANRL